MRRRVISAVLLAIIAVAFTAVLLQRYTFSSQVSGSDSFVVSSVHAYEPKELPPGFRLAIPVDAEALKVGDGQHFELDVAIDPVLAKLFTVRDALIVGEKATPLLNHLYFNQSPPEGVDARLLISGLKASKYQLDLYFAPRDGKADPTVGMKFFETPTLRRKNIRIEIANRSALGIV